MTRLLFLPAAVLLLTPAAPDPQALLPFADQETLRYNIAWPSGLSVGQAQMSAVFAEPAAGAAPRWTFEFTLDAAIPGFQVSDVYRSAATTQLCSLEFHKTLAHGKRKAREKTTFDPEAGVATRVTLGGGGKSRIPIEACAKDGLTFLYHLRSELARGRIPHPQAVLFGAPYGAPTRRCILSAGW